MASLQAVAWNNDRNTPITRYLNGLFIFIVNILGLQKCMKIDQVALEGGRRPLTPPNILTKALECKFQAKKLRRKIPWDYS